MFEKLSWRADLVRGMSERVGVNWSDRIAADPAVARDFRNAVLQCSGCRELGACQKFQATHSSAEEAPEYCLNGARFKEMKAS